MAGRLNADTATDTESRCLTSGRVESTARRTGAGSLHELLASMLGREPTERERELYLPERRRPEHSNTVAFTAGAVACPDRASASKHQQRGDWCVHPAPRLYVRRYQP